jgi:hypothetical protein
MSSSWKTELINFSRSPAFRTTKIRGNLVKAIIKVRNGGGSWTQVEQVISKFEPYMQDAKGLARWAFNNAR